MDLLAIGSDLGFIQQPGAEYVPTGSGQHALNVRYRGDARNLEAFLASKAKGTLIDDGFYVESVHIRMGLTDSILDTTVGNGGLVNGTVGEVEVTIHAVGAIGTYENDTIHRGYPSAGSARIYLISNGWQYDVNYSTVMRSVEVTQSTLPNGPANEVTPVDDPVIMTARPVIMGETEDGKEKLRGPLVLPTAFEEGTDYTAYNHFDGYSFVSEGNKYRATYYWKRAIRPILPV